MKDELDGVFTNKAVIVTGASSGIGEATAREFAKYGSKVMLAARSEDKLKRIVEEIRSLGQIATYKVTDVTKEEDCQALVEATVKEYGTVDILINNAGISMRALFTEVDLKVLRRLMDVNFWGTVQCTKYALPYILENKGALVGVSSVAGFHGLPGRTGYSASKFAIHGFLETVRIENLKSGMHVMVIAPGFTASEVRFHALTADGSEQGATPRKEEKMMTAEYVAHWILLGIKRKKRNKLLTWDGRFTALLQRIFPEQVDWIYYKAMQKEPNSPLK
ncbi:MAG: SDR family oxidoreductase [Bacteroidales bacterium]|nr:SDR family oxidoreductase [Bacteroidales bacterium]